jgi:osmotically inducible protein OsmC
MLVPGGDGLALAAELTISLPSITEEAADLVREAHHVCPYSNATRGNIDVTLVVNGTRL